MPDLVVATFNVRHCRGLDGRVDVERTARVLSSLGADLVALQELDRFLERSGRRDQPLLLSELTGMEIEFFATTRRKEGEYGIAVATTDPLEQVSYRALPRLRDEEPRGAIVGRFRGLGFLATHLATQRAPRRAQLAAVVELSSSLAPPAVVLGDLNCRGRALDPLREAGFRPLGDRRSRFWGRRKQIDHVLVGPRIEPGGARTLDSRASDHLPLVARLRYL